ncbi:MAG: hypothetical protein E6R07_07475 [Nevskiaceae bacterium]|nr:MAG: hypothetical protein E6R07_07475 [Nevskiaceae bacterium]
MFTIRLSRALTGTLLIISVALAGQVQAQDSMPALQPGSFQTIMSAKDPAHFGRHLPAADRPSTYAGPSPGSWQAIMSAKDPARYGRHLAAADLPPRAGCTLRPGSWEAIMSVKDPARYGPCGRK